MRNFNDTRFSETKNHAELNYGRMQLEDGPRAQIKKVERSICPAIITAGAFKKRSSLTCGTLVMISW